MHFLETKLLSYIIRNSTEHNMTVTAGFWKGISRYTLQFELPAFGCLKMSDHYHYRQTDYVGHFYSGSDNISSFITKWVFVPESLNLVIDDESAYESFRALDLLNYEVVGEANSSMFGLFDSFSLNYNQVPDQSNDISETCYTFIPENALFVGGDGNTHLHDEVIASNYDEVDRLLKNGAEVNLRNKTGSTSLEIARELGDDRMVSLLKHYGAREELFSGLLSDASK
ncbi:MAG: ankyrin repeat domain-containing protein [Bdellovibrionales bacterium]|nr:ankyrin repeat domain-containing protein [Bdellovibrionales bacterium]